MATRARTGRKMKDPGEKGQGKDTKYDRKRVDAVLDAMRNGAAAYRAAIDQGFKWSTFWDWVRTDRDGLRERYVDAKAARREVIEAEITEIADDGTNDYVEKKRRDGSTYYEVDSEHIQRSRLRCDVRRWLYEVHNKDGDLGRAREEKDATIENEAIAALERIAAGKSKSAERPAEAA